jgi:SNF2 family DNA or RNA helicase
MWRKLFIEVEAGEIEAVSAGVKMQKCHQIANGAVYYDEEGRYEILHDAKIEALQSIVEEAAGTPIIVVYTFRSDLERLKKAFPKGKTLDKDCSTWHSFLNSEVPILFMHPASGGHGLDGGQNVTNIICFYSVDFDLELRTQVIARIGAVRQAQAKTGKTVVIHQLIGRDTVDEIILDRIESKITVEEALKKALARRNLK